MAVRQDSSIHWREKGNALYTSVREGLCFTVSHYRLDQALQCYQKAFNMGKNDDELASAAKNLAMTGWKMLTLMSSSTSNAPIVIRHCKEAFKHFSYSHYHGQKVKSPDWLTGILTSARACWEHVFSHYINDLEYDERVKALYDLVEAVEIDCIKAECYLKLAECQFHRGVLALEKSNFKKGLSAMRECSMPIAETIKLSNDDDILTEARVLEKDVFIQLCAAESMQARATGDELFDKILMDEESLNLDMVWEVIDWYKQAILKTREVTEMELEAIAASRLGRVYDKVLKLKYRAKEYYKQAIQLAFSMHPRTFNTEDWYKEATERLEKYQSESVQAEQERESLDKRDIVKELEAEIKLLKQHELNTDEDFLIFVYKTFPPKDKRRKLTLPKIRERNTMQKCLQTAVWHYHPDSVDAEQYGKKWKVLCEEIAKVLTQRYQRYKL